MTLNGLPDSTMRRSVRSASGAASPGMRLHYSPDFYAAYVRDPDGNKLAAVCRGFTQRA